MKDFAEIGHMQPVLSSELVKPASEVFYLPHHSVVINDSSTTKLRVVFDASAKSSTGVSLNDTLLVLSYRQILFPYLLSLEFARFHLVWT